MTQNTNKPVANLAQTPVASVQPTHSRAIIERLENIESLNSIRSSYQGFSTKLSQLKDFYERIDGGNLKMIIADSDNHKVEFNNVALITHFLEIAIEKGDEHKKSLEQKILNFNL